MNKRIFLMGLFSSLLSLGSSCSDDKDNQNKAGLVAGSAEAVQTAAKPLQIGQMLPALTLKSQLGAIDLSSPGGPIVVYFYPRDDTPGCTVEAKGFRDEWSELQRLGVRVVGVSSDGEASHQKFQQKHSLPFDLVSDKDYVIAKAFGVPTRFGFFSRMTFVADSSGKIIKTFPDVKASEHAQEIVALLSK